MKDRIAKIEIEIIKAHGFIDIPLKDPKRTAKKVNDIFTDICKTNTTDIITGIKYGMSGKYGITYKLNTHVICFWVWKYKEDIKNSNKFYA